MLTVFTSDDCGPCAQYKRELAGLDNVNVVNIDDENNWEMAINQGIMVVPTSIMPDGTRWVGVKPRSEIMRLLGE